MSAWLLPLTCCECGISSFGSTCRMLDTFGAGKMSNPSRSEERIVAALDVPRVRDLPLWQHLQECWIDLKECWQ